MSKIKFDPETVIISERKEMATVSRKVSQFIHSTVERRKIWGPSFRGCEDLRCYILDCHLSLYFLSFYVIRPFG